MKPAPNVKNIPQDPMAEVIIFAGADAWIHAKDWMEYNKAGDNVPPVTLDKKQLLELDKLQIVDERRRCVRVYRAGALSQLQITAIVHKLALADVSEARFYSESHELLEDWTGQLSRIKSEAENAKSLILQSQKVVDGHLSQMAASQRGRLLAARYGHIVVLPESQNVFVYNGAVWEKVLDSDLRREMALLYRENEVNYSISGINNSVEAMKLEIPLLQMQRRELIGFSNGVYDLAADIFLPHCPENWLLNHNDVLFTPAVPGENLRENAFFFHKWLSHASGDDEAKMHRICAALYMVLANRFDWQLFIEVTGEGGSGKTVFTAIASMLVGEHNTASGNIKALDEARGRAQFVGKNLIILPDQPKYSGEGTGIKAITGGDRVEIDPKYEKPFTTVLRAIVLATNNEPMTFTERNGGIARRRVIFSFDHPVADSDKDTHLVEKIALELPVIIRFLLAAFTEQNSARSMLIAQRDSTEAMNIKCLSDPLYSFCAHIRVLEEPDGMMMGNKNIVPRAPRIYLYHAYLSWLEAHGYERPLTLTRFGKELPKVMAEYGSQFKKARTKAGIRYNLVLAESAEEWLPCVTSTITLTKNR